MAKTAQEKLDAKREKAYYKKHKKMYRTKPLATVIFNISNYIFFSAFTLTCIFPFYYLFINTVSDNESGKKRFDQLLSKGI